jgi:hypothetical protein
VTNLAEAGFLTDELVGHDMEARIHQMEEFSAANDRWATMYFIRVPSAQAPAAAAWIRQQLADDAEDAESDTADYQHPTSHQTLDAAIWRPVVLVVLAGVASFVLGQQFSDQQGRRLPGGNSLGLAVSRIGRPLVSEPVPGLPRHRLMFDRQREAWYLDSDRDGDGQFDSRQRFHASGATW